MGNCIRGGRRVRENDQDDEIKEGYYQDYRRHQQEEEGEEEKLADGFGKESGNKIKIVLTKEELEWLMFELKTNQGRKLEDVLQEIERERERSKVKVWKPSLESITECPEGF